ncbi:MAG TPA: zinc-binding alcohol dehydrogenase family protein [Stellaceae bacterium]|jgi:NADPH:quinone reductase-like Zn-dependent oxidoreductase|nr:zinc-binding alcohol dehydrogenase family protein [Stellaceae bacterium]
MKAAIVTELGKPPVYADFKEPILADGEVLIDISAAPLSHVTRYRASGTHYSSAGSLPFVVGLDGVGRHNGKRVYFILPRAPFGSMAQRTAVQGAHLVALPDDIDDATAAAIAIPAMSSWAALTVRSKMTPGQAVLVNGATGISGRLAVQIAKLLGAGKVIAAGRDAGMLQKLSALGADATVSLLQDDAAQDAAFTRHFSDGVDIVLDYLWGASAERLLAAAAKTNNNAKPVRFIQIGSSGGANISLPATTIRSSGLELIGCGMGSITLDQILDTVAQVFKAAGPHRLSIAPKTLPLAKIEGHWAIDTTATRTVFVMA